MEVATIWGDNTSDKLFTTHHTFWECMLRDQATVNPNLKLFRYTWNNMFDMPKTHDLYFFIDFDPRLFKLCHTSFHPRIFYWWDCFHHSYAYPAQVTEVFDRNYFAEINVVNALRTQGLHNVKWLPPAYYEGCYRPIQVPKNLHFAFVGQPDDTVIRKGMTRKQLVMSLHTHPKLRGFIGQQVYGEEVNYIYNSAYVLFDRTIYNNIGTRFFETIGSGGFLLMNRCKTHNGMDDLAVDGVHFISYDDSYEDLERKMLYYIEHHEEREKVIKAGHRFFFDNHRYVNRWNTILQDLGWRNL